MENVICKADIHAKVPGYYWLATVGVPVVLFPLSIIAGGPDVYEFESPLSFLFLGAIVYMIVFLIIGFAAAHSAKATSLALTDKYIVGSLRKQNNMKIPLEHVDNLVVKAGNEFGGKKIEIRSASGLIAFPYVHNADEFVDAALAQIDAVKNGKQAAPASAAAASSTDKIRDLKKLLDDGLISQEEFEAKRKELLANM
ncbi:MAG: SHOCT domain-containing protein [Oscillospiraceae bacterium]|nr:SHOCT domain-containing protein [Oscillospiraceae bacterium]